MTTFAELMAAINPPEEILPTGGKLSPETCDRIMDRWEQLKGSPDFTDMEKSMIFQAFVKEQVYGKQEIVWQDASRTDTTKVLDKSTQRTLI